MKRNFVFLAIFALVVTLVTTGGVLIRDVEANPSEIRYTTVVERCHELTPGGPECDTRTYTLTTYVYPAHHYVLLVDNTIAHVDHGETWISFPRVHRVVTAMSCSQCFTASVEESELAPVVSLQKGGGGLRFPSRPLVKGRRAS